MPIQDINENDDTTILLRDFSCLIKIELISKLCGKASSLKINFLKVSQTLWARAYKNRTDESRQMAWLRFSIKAVGVHFGNSIHCK